VFCYRGRGISSERVVLLNMDESSKETGCAVSGGVSKDDEVYCCVGRMGMGASGLLLCWADKVEDMVIAVLDG
jgi:hypothetical protein